MSQNSCKKNENMLTQLLLITGNVGSAFEDPSQLLNVWITTFLQKIKDTKPKFIALHLQEVGGKCFKKSMKYTKYFITQIIESDVMIEYNRFKIYIDEDFNALENFTALGNLYFIHNSVNSLEIWNFSFHKWEKCLGRDAYLGNIELIETKEKSKFSADLFPQFKFSRKGFMRTRWKINSTSIDLVNVHLFHDVSNIAACKQYSSKYSEIRRNALIFTLKRLKLDSHNSAIPYAIFGDFNFRCDTKGVVMNLTNNLIHHRIQDIENDNSMIHYYSSDGNKTLTIGKKSFEHINHQTIFKMPWLKKYDRETENLKEILFEYPIEFPPSYPYEEDLLKPQDFMYTRCPAWCDRILLSVSAKHIFNEIGCSYHTLGEKVCMGDHKPICLCINLKNEQDSRISCDVSNNQGISNRVAEMPLESFAISKKHPMKLENEYKINYIWLYPLNDENTKISDKTFPTIEINNLKNSLRETCF